MRRSLSARSKAPVEIEPELDEPLVEEPEADIEPQPQRTSPGGAGGNCRVILYNDDYHTQDEVVEQLHKATEYSLLRCWQIMLEAHIKGRAVCFHGTRPKCHHVTRVLREIRLQCEVDCDD